MSPANPAGVAARGHPDLLLESLRGLPLVCPLCHGELDVAGDAYRCPPCARTFPLQGGIPDFRVFPDPYLSPEEDRRRTDVVLDKLHEYRLERLLEYYWSFSDITPPVLRAQFVRSGMLGEDRARRSLRVLGDGTFRRPVTARRVLEVGSGTGNFLAEAVRHYPQVVGVDIGMRWLHLSRRRFLDRGLPAPPLVCCCAEHLPFPDGLFDLAVSSSTLEFTRDPDKVLAECRRTLTDRGCLYLNTVNRYSLGQNPYVYLWGIGFLPRSWQAGYARWRRGASFGPVRLLSLGELRRLARKHFSAVELALPDVDDEVLGRLPALTRWQARVYRLLKRLPLLRRALKWVGPQWDVKLSRAPVQDVQDRGGPGQEAP